MTTQTSPDVTKTDPRLCRLSERDDYEIVDESPDIRGWAVVSADGKSVGTVQDLIIDPQALRVRYMLVEVTPPAVQKTVYVLIPIGLADVDETWGRVTLRGIKAHLIPRMPLYRVYRGSQVLRDHEWAVRRVLTREDVPTTPASDQAFYDHPLFDDTRFLERRRRSLRDRAEAATPGDLNTNPYLRRREG